MLATVIATLHKLLVLAQEAPVPAPTTPSAPQGGNPLSFFLLIAVMIAIFYFVVFRDQRKKQRSRKEMLETIRKGDKVLTIGGIIGTIVNVKDNEITIKVDEASNTKITFVRTAIDRVLSSREGDKQEAA